MNVYISTALRPLTDRQALLEAHGQTIQALLEDIRLRYPELVARLVCGQELQHNAVRVWINGQRVLHLSTPVQPRDEVLIEGRSGITLRRTLPPSLD